MGYFIFTVCLLLALFGIRHIWAPWVGEWIIRRAMRDMSGYHLPGYMNRYWLLKPPERDRGKRRWWHIGIRVHEILRSDLDRHMHDHPWWNISVLLRGTYIEYTPLRGQHFDIGGYRRAPQAGDITEHTTCTVRCPGNIVFRKPTNRHKLVLPNGSVWSLFICGPWEQDWGFFVPNVGKVYWRAYLDEWNN
jgi:hypothetical protein